MARFDEEEEATLFGIRSLWMWGLSISALCLVIGAIVVKTSPWFEDKEREGIEHSRAFVASKKELILKLVNDYDALNTSIEAQRDNLSFVEAAERQKKAIVARVKLESESLPEGEVPPAARSLLQK